VLARVNFDTLKRWGSATFEGFLQTQAPSLIRGFLIEYLNGVTLDRVVAAIKNDESLWSMAKPEEQENIRRSVARIGGVDFLTPDWVIGAIKNDHPSIASLFLGWDDARSWLERQIEVFQQEAG